jgi:ribosomal protein S4
LLVETRQRLARVEGELADVQARLTSSAAAEAQLRKELDAGPLEAVRLEAEAELAQNRLRDHKETAGRRISELEDQLSEARRIQREAGRERAAVIAALGRRSRRHLGRPPESEVSLASSDDEKESESRIP